MDETLPGTELRKLELAAHEGTSYPLQRGMQEYGPMQNHPNAVRLLLGRASVGDVGHRRMGRYGREREVRSLKLRKNMEESSRSPCTSRPTI